MCLLVHFSSVCSKKPSVANEIFRDRTGGGMLRGWRVQNERIWYRSHIVGGGVQKASGLISVSKELNALGALIQYILACLCVLSNLKGRWMCVTMELTQRISAKRKEWIPRSNLHRGGGLYNECFFVCFRNLNNGSRRVLIVQVTTIGSHRNLTF